MSYDDIIEQFATAQVSSTKVPWKAGYEATSESGMIFRWYENNGTVISFFPKY